ncbi:hypothetical protein Landi51_06680 [Colletotrichum acutatum]
MGALNDKFEVWEYGGSRKKALLQWCGSDGWDVVTMEIEDWKAKGEFGFGGAGMVDVRSNARRQRWTFAHPQSPEKEEEELPGRGTPGVGPHPPGGPAPVIQSLLKPLWGPC